MFNCIVVWGVQFIATDYDNIWSYSAINAMFVTMVIITDMYLILFNTFIVIIREELFSISICMERAVRNTNLGQFTLLRNMHGKILRSMDLVTRSFALPVLFYILLSFFEGTLQVFQMYFMVIDTFGTMTSSQIAEDILSYFSWLGPLMVKLIVTLNLATRTSEVVSWCLFK